MVTFTRFWLVMAEELESAGRNRIAFSNQFQMFQRTRKPAFAIALVMGCFYSIQSDFSMSFISPLLAISAKNKNPRPYFGSYFISEISEISNPYSG